jgi:hypothetical protein
MKSIIFILFTILTVNTVWGQKNIESTQVTVDSLMLNGFFNSERIRPYHLSYIETKAILVMLNSKFNSIKETLNLQSDKLVDSYRYQLISGRNANDEIIVYVIGIGKSLPQYLQSNWQKNIILLKCTNDEYIHVTLNLSSNLITEMHDNSCD